MDLGLIEVACRIFSAPPLLGLDVGPWLGSFREAWASAFEIFWRAVEFLIEHSPKIFGVAGFSFGVWRWWYYRESVLHKRLQEYLAEQETRLRQARSYVLEAMLRPGPKRRFAEPLFAVRPLRALLRRRGWRLLFGVRKIEVGADGLLRRALRKIGRQLETAENVVSSLYDQRASAFILRGAIASARAGNARSAEQSAQFDRNALDDFRFALQIPGKHQVEAKEYEAHQLRRLGNLGETEAAYKELEAMAIRMLDGQSGAIIRARALRWLASITQARAVEDFRKGLKPSARSPLANRLMTGQRHASGDADNSAKIDKRGALPLRAPYVRQFQNWDAIEQADMHYLSAFIYHQLGWNRQQGKQLELAETFYKAVTNHTPSSKWLIGGAAKRLHDAARAGLERVRAAQHQSEYDTNWLLPPSNDPKDQSPAISNSGGN